MEIEKYIKFSDTDIIEALQDLYKKRTGNEIDINFDDNNRNSFSMIQNIVIKVTLEQKAEVVYNAPQVGVKLRDIQYKDSGDISIATPGYGPNYPISVKNANSIINR